MFALKLLFSLDLCSAFGRVKEPDAYFLSISGISDIVLEVIECMINDANITQATVILA